jgi:hypothetical protein
MNRLVLVEILSESFQFVNGSSDAPPSIGLQCRVTLPVQTKMGIILTLNKPVSSFQFVATPRLHRQWLVQIIVMTYLLVGFFNLRLDGIGGR